MRIHNGWYFHGKNGRNKNFNKNFNLCQKLNVKLINLIIPDAFENMNNLKKQFLELQLIEQLDYARDYHHFDFKTSEYIVDLIIKMNSFDKIFK